jgi:superfamily II DNA/RNA helicase
VKCKTSQLAVGTPGRVKQLITEGHLATEGVRLVVLDEADKLLEPAFIAETTAILNLMPRYKQVLALSATYPEQLAKLAERFMRNPQHVRPGQTSQVLTGVSQFLLPVPHCPAQARQTSIKHTALLKLLSTVPYSQVLVFSNYSTIAQSTTDFLNSRGFPAIFMSAGQDQSRRLAAIQSFRQFNCRILCSTDLTARGIDAENVNLVVNLEVPWEHNTYLHRIGRGGRYGSLSYAVTLASQGVEVEKMRSIVSKTGSEIRILPTELPLDLRATSDSMEILEIKAQETVEADSEISKEKIGRKTREDRSVLLKHDTGKSSKKVDEKVLNEFIRWKKPETGFVSTDIKEIDDVAVKLKEGLCVDVPLKITANDETNMASLTEAGEVAQKKAKERKEKFKKKFIEAEQMFEGKDVSFIINSLDQNSYIDSESQDLNEVNKPEENVASKNLKNSETIKNIMLPINERDVESEPRQSSSFQDCDGSSVDTESESSGQNDTSPSYGYDGNCFGPSGYPDNFQFSHYPGYFHHFHPGQNIDQNYSEYLQSPPSQSNNLAWYSRWMAEMAIQRQAVQNYYFWVFSSQQ